MTIGELAGSRAIRGAFSISRIRSVCLAFFSAAAGYDLQPFAARGCYSRAKTAVFSHRHHGLILSVVAGAMTYGSWLSTGGLFTPTVARNQFPFGAAIWSADGI